MHSSGPQAKLQEAGQIVNARYEKILGQRARIESLLARLQEVLKEPARQWPFGAPRKRPRYDVGLDATDNTPPPSPGIPAGAPAAPPIGSVGSAHSGPRIPGEISSLSSMAEAGGRTSTETRQGQ